MKRIKNFFSPKQQKLLLDVPQGKPEIEHEEINLQEVQDLWSKLEDSDLERRPAYVRFNADVQGFVSTDLTEATYSTPHEVLNMNCELLDSILETFPVWRVYHKLFKLHDREVDCEELNRKGYCEVTNFTTKCGGFMGDPLSFVHLTLQMAATVNVATKITGESSSEKYDRPLGQSAGDDLLLVGPSAKFYKNLRKVFDQTNMTLSKIDSWSPDSMTFCEQYALKPIDGGTLSSYNKESVFADLFYLDIIKGSLLSGKSKVKTVGAIPLIGHSRALNTQVRYHPIKWIRERSIVLLWSANYMQATKLASSMASLPPSLGGISMALGRVLFFEDSTFQKRLPYYEAIAKLPQESFLAYQLLLQGIYKSNPKGITWENSPEVLKELLSKLTVMTEEEYQTLKIPLALTRKGYNAIRRFVKNELGFVSIREILDEITRRDAFLKQWQEKEIKTFLTMPLKGPKLRMTRAWQYIYSTVQPVEIDDKTSNSIEELAQKFDIRTWGLFVSKEDPALQQFFNGMPSLTINYSRQ